MAKTPKKKSLQKNQTMPPRLQSHSLHATQVAAELMKVLEDQTQPNSKVREDAVFAFLDEPGIFAKLKMPCGCGSKDIPVAGQILSNMSESMNGVLNCNGKRSLSMRTTVESTASVIISGDMNFAAVTRLTGISPTMLEKGEELKKQNASSGAEDYQAVTDSKKVVTYPYSKIHEWFHNQCSMVTPNKNTKREYTKKTIDLPNGEKKVLTCDFKVRYGSENELAMEYLESQQHKDIMFGNPRLKLCLSNILKCICPCIKPCAPDECICPCCTQMTYYCEAVHKMRKQARDNNETCSCVECKEGTKWSDASQNISACRASFTCGKKQYPHLKNPASNEIPQFAELKCSLLPTTTGHHPPCCEPCGRCGWDNVAPKNCPVQMNNDECYWTEKEKKAGPRGEDVYTKQQGTRKQLIEKFRDHIPIYNHHKFVHHWTKHNFDLCCETFDGKKKIVIVTDFAAQYKMKQKKTEKCTQDCTCNELVVLVLHSPDDRTGIGTPRSVVCDVWRIWSAQKGDVAFNQFAMKNDIIPYYQQLFKNDSRNLEEVIFYSDGCRCQYKCGHNQGANAEWPHPVVGSGVDCLCKEGMACGSEMKSGLGVNIIHNFFVSHHGSGPWDNYGKVPRKLMDAAVNADKLSRFNYEHCFDFCVANMSQPSTNHTHTEMFSANNHHFRAYATKGAANPRGFPVIPDQVFYEPIRGSNNIYSFRATSGHLPQIESLFLPCYCAECLIKMDSVLCLSRPVTHSLVADSMPYKVFSHQVTSAPRRAAEESDYDE